MVKRIRDYGIKIGRLKTGKLNKITDVEGVRVGHCTIDTEEQKTGVTIILPTRDNIYKNKLVAGSYVINGFGKTAGLVQIEELGSLESPIAMTNTLNLGKVHDALVDYTIKKTRDDKIDLTSFNPVVCECNDSFLNNIQNRVVGQEEFYRAVESAGIDFMEGDVGAGKGMSCHELKGGIGSSSRLVNIGSREYTLGVLVLSNHGLLKDLKINGSKVGSKLDRIINPEAYEIEGSIIIVIGTDLPLSSRQLKRLCKRSVIGLGNVGSNINNGSGDIAIAFSTYNSLNKSGLLDLKFLSDDSLNEAFRAVIESTEEAILNSMVTSNSQMGYRGRERESLKDYMEEVLKYT